MLATRLCFRRINSWLLPQPSSLHFTFPRMKRSLLPGLLATALLTATLTACDTGTKAGDTNVEDSEYKDKEGNHGQTTQADSTTSSLQTDTSNNPTGREVYEGAADRKDRNNDGIAD